MSLALLHSALLIPVESLVNRMLALDPAARSRLDALDDRTLAVCSTQPQAQVFISFRSGRVHLRAVGETGADASLHGPLTALLGLLRPEGALTSLYPQGLELRGDTAFVQQVRQLLLSLHMDWEYQLVQVLGDIPTQTLGNGLRQAGGFVADGAARLRENTGEFLLEESRLLVGAAELEQQYQLVAEFVLALDRLHARIDRLS